MLDPVQVAVRLGLYAILGVLFGLPLFALYGVDRAGGTGLRLRLLIGVGATLGLALSALGLAVLAASMAGVPLAEVDRATIEMVAAMPGVGTAWLTRVAALSTLLAAVIVLRGRRALAVVGAVLGAIALASLAATGHAAMTEGAAGYLPLGADIAHLLAAGAWLGAIVGLLLLIVRPPETDHAAVAHRALAAFATTGAVMVGVLAVSGLANGWFIVGADVVTVATSSYGQLLLVKLGLFIAMLGLAAVHRFRLTPALDSTLDADPAAALGRLRASLAVEAAIGLCILALVAALGLVSPR